MLDQYVLQEAYQRNIMVYDKGCPRGEFSERLAALLSCVGRRNQPRMRVEAIYVPEELVYDENLTAAGIYIIPDKRLNIGGELHTYFVEELKGAFARSCDDGDGADRYICVAVSTEASLLGSIP